MRLCALKDIESGTVLGKSLYEVNGKLLLGAGYRITREMKSKLLSRKYTHIYIMEEGTEDVVPEDVISDEVKLQAKSKLADKVAEIEKQDKFKDVSLSKARKLIEEGYLKDVDVPYAMRAIVGEILKDISAVGATFAKMVMIKSEDSYFMDHAINTSVLAILVGKKYRFTPSELKCLALGTFLHDIGKVILKHIGNSENPDKIAELYKEHPTFGYLLLNNSGSQVSPMETQIVNQHHEFQDGSGFPIGLKSQNQPPIQRTVGDSKGQIYRLAEICCVVNAFDNMVFNPYKKEPMSPGQAFQHIIKDAGNKYNKSIVQTLLKIVPSFPVGVSIRVQNLVDPQLIGYQGVVAKINEKHINKPVIILNKDKFLKKIKPMVIDTSNFTHVDLEILV